MVLLCSFSLFFFFLLFLLEGDVLTAILSEEEITLGENPREGGHHAQSLITTFTDRDHQEISSVYSVTEL